jgi:CubicO group peptidase (beta-lactamase class C family)
MKPYQTISHLFQAITLTILVLALGLDGATAWATPATPSSLDFTAIDAYIAAQMEDQRIPGLALGIVQGDQIVHLKGFGQADASGRPVTPQTPFIIASVSKSVTALAVMQLVEQGKIDLDAPVQRYLPFFRVADPDASSHITVRHLLNHTSGLPESADVALLTSTDTSEGALEHQVRDLHSIELNRPVGATFEYVNANYATLGLIVQTVSGQSYEAYVQQHVFAPLDMRHSFASQAEAQPDGLASGSRFWFGVPIPANVADNRAEHPSGRLIASTEDMAHFLIAQLNGGRYAGAALLSPAGIATMHQPAVKLGDGGASYGMGWFTGERDGVTTVEHSGDGVNFHANVVLVPDHGLGIVLLENAENVLKANQIDAISRGVTSLLLGDQPAAMESGGLYLMVYRVVLLMAAIQVFGMVRSIVQIRRWRAQPEDRPRGRRELVWHIGVPLVLNLAHGFVFLYGLTAIFETSLAYLCLYVPDLGYTLIVSGTLALAWAIVRTALVWQLVREQPASDTVAVLKQA